MTRWLVTISCGIVQTLPPKIGVAGISWSKNLDCRLFRFLQNTCTARFFHAGRQGSRHVVWTRLTPTLAGSDEKKIYVSRKILNQCTADPLPHTRGRKLKFRIFGGKNSNGNHKLL